MRKALTGIGSALALLATGLTAAAPADAQRFRGGGYHGGYGYRGGYGYGYRGYRGGGAGLALGAGILGLAAGAAIASRPYYGPRGGYGYYAPPPPPPAYYGYGAGYGYAPAPRCWDGYAGYYRPC